MYPVLGQGNANVIYVREDGLLRVSKNNTPPGEVLEYFARWKELLPDYIGDMKVVDDPHFGEVLLMEHVGKDGSLLVEFKPKWLEQSPDAPVGALSCRTCAVTTMRGKPKGWCPLALGEKKGLEQIVASMGSKSPEAVAAFLASTDLLDRLRELQRGPSVFGDATPEFLHAMSARDCTVLIEGRPKPDGSGWWQYSPDLHIRARIVDLDPKNPDQMPKWRRIEEELREYYPRRHPVCELSK